MTQELTRYETAPIAPVVTSEQLDLVRRTVANGANDAELQLYLYDCQRHGVHPLDKLLHFTKRSGKYTPITSIDLLRSRASDTGDLAGIDDPQHRGEPMSVDFTASVTVYRMVQGIRCPFTATARWTEYKPADGQDHMWRKMPYLMLGKCAEALALRKAFPRQLAGLYAKEEMDQAGDSGASYIPRPTDNREQYNHEHVIAPSVAAAPVGVIVCDICGAVGRKSQKGDGYYCPNKQAHGGKWYTIPENAPPTPALDEADYPQEDNLL